MSHDIGAVGGLSTHIMQDAEYVCDDLILLESGVASFAGSLSELLNGESGQINVEGTGLDQEFLSALSGAGVEVLDQAEGRLTFVSRSDDDLRRFWQLVNEHEVEVRHLGREGVSLEDVVVKMMGGKT